MADAAGDSSDGWCRKGLKWWLMSSDAPWGSRQVHPVWDWQWVCSSAAADLPVKCEAGCEAEKSAMWLQSSQQQKKKRFCRCGRFARLAWPRYRPVTLRQFTAVTGLRRSLATASGRYSSEEVTGAHSWLPLITRDQRNGPSWNLPKEEMEKKIIDTDGEVLCLLFLWTLRNCKSTNSSGSSYGYS